MAIADAESRRAEREIAESARRQRRREAKERQRMDQEEVVYALSRFVFCLIDEG